MQIRILKPDDAPAMFALRRQALADAPLAFAASPEDDLAASVEAVRDILDRAPHSAVFGAFDDGLVGMLGLYRERKRKMAHKVFLWGAFVTPEARGRGAARALVQAALAHARRLDGVDQVQISASEDAGPALALYESLGFRAWGTEPDAIRHDGRRSGEVHMALALSSEHNGPA